MFKEKSIFESMHAGGFTIYILIFCSVISIAVIIERILYFQRRSRISRVDLMEQVRGEINHNKISTALDICRNIDTPCSRVALAGLILNGHDEKVISNAMEREITVETIKLERFTSIVATIGGTAVYIGLFGTVLGIMHAFGDIAKAGSSGMDLVTTGISEALVCTAAGLLVAIPAVVAYNYFMRTIDNFVADMELTASELLDFIAVKKK